MIIRQHCVGPFQMNCYIVADPESRQGFVVDPGDEIERILADIRSHRFEIDRILLTHGHIDHVQFAQDLKTALGVPMYIHREDRPWLDTVAQQALMFGLSPGPRPEVDGFLEEGDIHAAGPYRFRVIHTPGHSPGHVILAGDEVALVGDTIFSGSIGRTDLPGGDYDVLMRSIFQKILPLGEGMRIYPGHGPASTLAEELKSNPFLQQRVDRAG
ncbi:MAG: MBL fold metallo-hydrolase [Candidatus Eremiobacterota bacterium]